MAHEAFFGIAELLTQLCRFYTMARIVNRYQPTRPWYSRPHERQRYVTNAPDSTLTGSAWPIGQRTFTKTIVVKGLTPGVG